MAYYIPVNTVGTVDTLPAGFNKINNGFAALLSSAVGSGWGGTLVGFDNTSFNVLYPSTATTVQGALFEHIVTNSSAHLTTPQANFINGIISNGTTPSDLFYLTGATPGTAVLNKAVVLSGSSVYDWNNTWHKNIKRLDLIGNSGGTCHIRWEFTTAGTDMKIWRVNTGSQGSWELKLIDDTGTIEAPGGPAFAARRGIDVNTGDMVCTEIALKTELLTYNDNEVASTIDLFSTTGIAAPLDSKTLDYNAITWTFSALPTHNGTVRVHAFDDCYVKFGDGSISSYTGYIYVPAGTETFGVDPTWTYVMVKGVNSSGAINITGCDKGKHGTISWFSSLDYSSGSSNIILPTGDIIRIFATTDCFIKLGTSGSVTADNNSIFFPAGTEYITRPILVGHQYIAAKSYTLGGSLSLTGINL